MKKLLLLIALVLGLTSMHAQTAPTDSIYQAPQNLVFTGSNFAGELQSNYEVGTGGFSIMFTLTPKKTAGTLQYIASKGNSGSAIPGWSLFLEGSTLKFRVCGATSTLGNYRAGASVPFPDATYLNQPVKIVAIVDRTANKVDLYVNGSNAATVSGVGTPSSWTIDAVQDITAKALPLQIGQDCNAGNKFTGTISDFKVYNRTLSANEITDANAAQDYTYTTTQVLELTGTNPTTVSNPMAPKFTPGTGSYTVLFAITPNQTSVGATIQTIAGKGNTGSSISGWSILEGEGYIGFRICGTTSTGNYRASARISFPDATYLGQLVYGAAVIDRGTGKVDFYLNGSNTGVVYSGYGPTSNVIDGSQDISAFYPFIMGQTCTSTGNKYKGTLNSLSIYNRVLTSNELAAWKPTSTANTDAQYKTLQIVIKERKIAVLGIENFEVYSITGQKQNIKQPLNTGVYILKTIGRTQKFVVY